MARVTAPFADPIESSLQRLIEMPHLDERASRNPELTLPLFSRLAAEADRAWDEDARDHDEDAVEAARLVCQRALYRLNRLRLYWGDDPSLYVNERSIHLARLLERLERPWQRWLAQQVSFVELDASDAQRTLRAWAERDLTPRETPESRWVAQHMNLAGYRRLLEIGSLNGLVEASQLSRAVGGTCDPIQNTLFRILIEEYGAGRPEKKHSTFFASMLAQQGMSSEPEAYLSLVPWEVLSAINHSFFLTEYKQNYLRFCGAFTYTELSTPVSFAAYASAARRLGLSQDKNDYWALHVREDERHGAWMLEKVAFPLLARFPHRQREVLFGYAQQRLVEHMAGRATVRACRIAAGNQP